LTTPALRGDAPGGFHNLAAWATARTENPKGEPPIARRAGPLWCVAGAGPLQSGVGGRSGDRMDQIIVPEYPKIETLYDRSAETFKVIPGEFRLDEFQSVSRWDVTEKIDGTNVRIALLPDGRVFYGGRTDAAQMPPTLLAFMQEMFTAEKLAHQFAESAGSLVVLYGEGYGERIQKGGGNYREGVSVRLFDVRVGDVWLAHESLQEIAENLFVGIAPVLGRGVSLQDAIDMVAHPSQVALAERNWNKPSEGIVARSSPLMLDRMGRRVMWKLKAKDF